MKLSLLSCNIGGIDNIYPPPKQTTKYDFYYYTENNLPFPLPNIDNRMKGKYLKTQAHRFINTDLLAWMDGSIKVKDGTFIAWMEEQMKDCDVMISKHAERNSPYEEIAFIMEHMKKGHPYLLSRYAKQPFRDEIEFYKSQGLPIDYPLFNCFFFCRRNSERVNKAFDDWWDITVRYSNFDQAAFSYAAWLNKLKIKVVDTESYFERKRHNENTYNDTI